ncbi:hypothetical protein CKU38_00114 [Xanthomonas citri pv. fuscans]|nr:hypothetical protein CKU38_00114 [Xanthomonas citri pv. fuscans]
MRWTMRSGSSCAVCWISAWRTRCRRRRPAAATAAISASSGTAPASRCASPKNMRRPKSCSCGSRARCSAGLRRCVACRSCSTPRVRANRSRPLHVNEDTAQCAVSVGQRRWSNCGCLHPLSCLDALRLHSW